MMHPVLDSLDRRILNELQRDCTISGRELAHRCGTTESTALRRWRRLRRERVIERESAIVNPAAVGRPLAVVVTIRVERIEPNDTADKIEEISRHAAVAQFHHVTGTTDYIAVIRAPTMADYQTFVDEVLQADPRFATRSYVVIRTLTDRPGVTL